MQLLQLCIPVFSLLQLGRAATLPYDFPASTSHPVAFKISVNQALVDESRNKARNYRPSLDLEDDSNKDWLYGPSRAEMTAIAAHWADAYNWHQVQDEINANFSHYAITVPSGPEYGHEVPLHFVHERSVNDDAIPLLLLHGWPSSHLEWSRVIQPLVSPKDSASQHYHVVAPDLPGYGFSPAPLYAGLTPSQMGIAFDNLMHALGYNRYGLVTTDLGWWVGMWMTEVVPDSLIGHMADFWMQAPNLTDLERFAGGETSPDETAYITAYQAWMTKHSGYSDIQSKAPLALGQAMTDSPVGYAGWILQPVRAVSDGYQYSLDEIITMTMMVWIQGTWGALRSYVEFLNTLSMNFPRTAVPTGLSEWSNAGSPFADLEYFQMPPRSWVERLVNLVYFTRHTSGGHFPAQTRPDIWVKGVREFFSSLVKTEDRQRHREREL